MRIHSATILFQDFFEKQCFDPVVLNPALKSLGVHDTLHVEDRAQALRFMKKALKKIRVRGFNPKGLYPTYDILGEKVDLHRAIDRAVLKTSFSKIEAAKRLFHDIVGLQSFNPKVINPALQALNCRLPEDNKRRLALIAMRSAVKKIKINGAYPDEFFAPDQEGRIIDKTLDVDKVIDGSKLKEIEYAAKPSRLVETPFAISSFTSISDLRPQIKEK